MLETILATSLALSASFHHYQPVVNPQGEVSSLSIAVDKVHLAKGRPHQSRYREEADRSHEELESHHENYGDRVYRDYQGRDNYRRDRDYRSRDRYPQEVEYRRNGDRYYRQERYRYDYPTRDRRYRY